MQDAVTETDHLGAPGTTHLSSHRRQRALELPPVEDDETRQLQEAMVLSLQEERRQEEERKRMRDAVLVERLMLSELTQREATEAEARRVATEAVVAQAWRRQVCEQIDESRRLVAVELFVLRAATALNEVAAIARLRRATLTIGIAAASQLLEQTLLLEAAGGMLRNDGSGLRRTAGGVYLGVLLRENVSRDEYKFIQAAIKRHRPSVAPVYIRGVPPSATAADVNDALKTKFGSWGYGLRADFGCPLLTPLVDVLF